MVCMFCVVRYVATYFFNNRACSIYSNQNMKNKFM